MKNFVYFEAQEGGMDTIENIKTADDLRYLRGWMDKECIVDDEEMVKWMETALVGQLYNHRLGSLVRLLDK